MKTDGISSPFFQVLFLVALLATTAIKCQDELDEFGLEDEDDEIEKEKDPISKRQYNAVRDTIRNLASNTGKFIANNRFVKGVQNAISNYRRPAGAGNPAASSVIASQTPNIVSTIYRQMRSHWAKQSADANQIFRRQLNTITKRLTNSKIIIGNLGSKLSNRDESATKEATKTDEAAPTAESKIVLSKSEADSPPKTEENKISSTLQSPVQDPTPLVPMVQVPVMPPPHPPHHHPFAYHPPPQMYDAPFYPEW